MEIQGIHTIPINSKFIKANHIELVPSNRSAETRKLKIDCIIGGQYKTSFIKRVPSGGYCHKNIDKISSGTEMEIEGVFISGSNVLAGMNIDFPKCCNDKKCKEAHECTTMQQNIMTPSILVKKALVENTMF